VAILEGPIRLFVGYIETEPSLPAALIASDDGQPVYEKMGCLRLCGSPCGAAPRRDRSDRSNDRAGEL